jgi:magnesium transporter
MEILRKSKKTGGLPPGTVVYTGDKKSTEVKIQVIDYDEATIEEHEVKTPEECEKYLKSNTVSWINVTGIHDTEIIERMGKLFKLHPLVLEDIANTNQRPKIEDYEDYLYIVCKMIFYDKNEELKVVQVSMIVANSFILTFEETEGDVFDILRLRLRNGKGKVRKLKTDYLAYSLLDSMVDNYFISLEKIGEEIEDIEEEVIKHPRQDIISDIQKMRRDLIYIRKSVWPMREVSTGLERDESKIIKKGTKIYVRDLYDHTIQAIDVVETYRDVLSGLIDMHLSSMSNKMNEIMKFLTIISTIFMPLTFITSLYGMNFVNLPELHFQYGYYYLWIALILMSSAMLLYFRRKKWI